METASEVVGFICPVCGYTGLTRRPYAKMKTVSPADSMEPPYSTFMGEPSYEVCPCCGFEFGNDDEPRPGVAGASFAEYRAKWLDAGAEWSEPSRKPADWDVHRQLLAARLER